MKGWKSIEVPKGPGGRRLSRVEVFETAVFKHAWDRMWKTMNPSKQCKHGHDLTKMENVDVAGVLWDGKPVCYLCWKKANDKYLAKNRGDVQIKVRKVKPNGTTRRGKQEDSNIVALISRQVASKTLGDARLVPAAHTRQEFFNLIEAGGAGRDARSKQTAHRLPRPCGMKGEGAA